MTFVESGPADRLDLYKHLPVAGSIIEAFSIGHDAMTIHMAENSRGMGNMLKVIRRHADLEMRKEKLPRAVLLAFPFVLWPLSYLVRQGWREISSITRRAFP